jgi:methylenetetrahydrofolate dehydrogenase (NADP+)/methenyltetrahydrofolate cyclohydrolase
MTAQTLDGSALSKQLIQNLALSIRQANCPKPPLLTVILVGQDPASQVYVNKKQTSCAEAGIQSELLKFDADFSQAELLDKIFKLNQDPDVHGILVQLPLPPHIDTKTVLDAILPAKDVDGFHPFHLGRLAQKRPSIRPCTPKGIMTLLKHYQINPKGMDALVIGASNIVGRPMALELLQAQATVTIAHSQTKDLQTKVQQADLLVVAVGKANFIKGSWIKTGAVVIDVGIHRLDNGKLTGDVNFEEAKLKASYITPVPGGVGPMTVCSLLENCWEAYQTSQQSNR